MAKFGGHFLIDHLLACAVVKRCGYCEMRHQEILVFFDVVDRHAFSDIQLGQRLQGLSSGFDRRLSGFESCFQRSDIRWCVTFLCQVVEAFQPGRGLAQYLERIWPLRNWRRGKERRHDVLCVGGRCRWKIGSGGSAQPSRPDGKPAELR
ncbi:hypothetical protein XP4B_17450 [Xanthomonas perforans]|nr:hypothetical protein XP4B_17450 [Xanthomonas perforans]